MDERDAFVLVHGAWCRFHRAEVCFKVAVVALEAFAAMFPFLICRLSRISTTTASLLCRVLGVTSTFPL
jgi:hypothetical protein